MNSITVIGNLGQDPEIKFFDNGGCVCKFTIADNQKKKDAPPIWWNVEVWGKSGEFAANYCKKGTKVAVVGNVKQDEWTSKNTGEPVKRLTVSGSSIEKLSRDDDQGSLDEDTPVKDMAAAIREKVDSQPVQADFDDF